MQMLRYAALLAACLVATRASAQQTPPQADAPAPASPAASTAASKPVVSMEEPQPGDHWTYEVRDEITGTVTATRTSVVTEVTPAEISTRVNTVGKPEPGQIVFDRSWNIIISGSWKYSPNDGTGIRMPLSVGKSWPVQSNNVNAANANIWKRSGSSKVVGQETVTTRAGTFETFKIETRFNARNVNDPTRQSEVLAETWYAPAIDHWVTCGRRPGKNFLTFCSIGRVRSRVRPHMMIPLSMAFCRRRSEVSSLAAGLPC
jgi:hypothetical protein